MRIILLFIHHYTGFIEIMLFEEGVNKNETIIVAIQNRIQIEINIVLGLTRKYLIYVMVNHEFCSAIEM